jgi:hypothetical protein
MRRRDESAGKSREIATDRFLAAPALGSKRKIGHEESAPELVGVEQGVASVSAALDVGRCRRTNSAGSQRAVPYF